MVRVAIGADFVQAHGDAEFEKKAIEDFIAVRNMLIEQQRKYSAWLEVRKYDQETQRIQRLGDQLSSARASLEKARLEAFHIKEGMIVRATAGRYRGELFKVTSINPEYGWLRGNPKRKDGSWSTSERALYSEWELVP